MALHCGERLWQHCRACLIVLTPLCFLLFCACAFCSQPAVHIERASTQSGVVSVALLLAECEASLRQAPLDSFGMSGAAGAAGSPQAMSFQQASRQLQQRSFKTIMKTKYAQPASKVAQAASAMDMQ